MLRIILMAISRIFWYVVSLNVMAGATVIESPVWIPIGSMFSIEQMMMMLSFLSRSNSSSYSFHPSRALSIITSWIGLISSPRLRAVSNSSSVCTKVAPAPPRVNEARTQSGKPNSWAVSFPRKKLFAIRDGAIGTSISSINLRNSSLSSVMLIASISTPIILTPFSSQMPCLSASIHRFNAVCPPIVGRTTSISGCVFKISSMLSTVSGLR